MAIFKCKMCGGSLELNGESSVATCDYCGSVQTLPKKNDDVIANLFNRANNLRIKCEFDKASEVYEKIINEDNTEAEAHWGLVLCKYGIEYVEDPKTYKRIPTCHRTQYESVLTDVDYLAAIENADGASKSVYQAQAEEISALQKDILAIVKNEKPFDVFICYKETDENGKRTVDSALADDIYYQLTQEGLNVFYAAITLEEKLGQEYEPYIFAALNSAKVMLVVGTKPEYFGAVWVKNEWARFLKIMKTDRSKLLIPCYRDMDAYDLPEEFSHLQAQDMSKIGFVNDVVRGIKKVVAEPEKKETVTEKVVASAPSNSSIAPLLERAFMFLEDEDWQSADEYCEKVLDLDPKCAEAYLGKLMAELKIGKQDDLKDCAKPFDKLNNYQKAIRFGDEKLKKELEGCIDFITERNLTTAYNLAVKTMDGALSEDGFKKAADMFKQIKFFKDSEALAAKCLEKAQDTKLEALYHTASQKMKFAESEKGFIEAAREFEALKDFKDSADKAKLCLEKADEARKDAILDEAKEKMNNHSGREKAIELLESISGWKDADEQVKICREMDATYKANLEKSKKEAEARAKLIKKTVTIVISVVLITIVFMIILSSVIIPNIKYNAADELAESGKYSEAISAFEELDGYKDSADKIKETQYNSAVAALEKGEKAKAAMLFGKLDDYKDASEKSLALWKEASVRECVSAGGYHTVGLKNNGNVVALGYTQGGRCDVSSLTDIVAVSAGSQHTIGLKKDGAVVAKGINSFGQCDVSDWTDIVAVSASNGHTVGLKKDGTVVAIGDNRNGQCDVSDWIDIVAISAGYDHTIGLKTDGTVVAVGSNYNDQCDVSDWTDIVAISAGWEHSVALKIDGTVVSSGNNEDGQCNVSDWTDIVAVSAGGYHTVGLKKDGTLVATGFNEDGQCNIKGWTDIVAVSAGGYYTVGLKKDGTLLAIGDNEDGQCDVSNWKDIKLPNNVK